VSGAAGRGLFSGLLPEEGDLVRRDRGPARVLSLDLIVVRFTDRAVMVRAHELAEPVWLPLSQVEVDASAGGVTVVELPEWLAVEKGLA